MSQYIKNGLVVDFDINDINQSDYSLVSKHKWNKTKTSEIILKDYGLTQSDIGFSNDLKNEFTLNENKFVLKRIGETFIDGTTDYSNNELELQTLNNVGNVLFSNGGYLLNSFKYHNFDVEYMPRYFSEGFTFETTLFITDDTFTNINNNSNIFLSLGVRAEDKFANSYTGNTKYITSEGATLDNSYKIYDVSNLPENTQNINEVNTFLSTEQLFIRTNNQKEFQFNELLYPPYRLILNNTELTEGTDYHYDERSKTITLTNTVGVTINDGLVINYYKNISEETLVNTKIQDLQNNYPSSEYGIENNLIVFKFNESGNIGYRKINQLGNIEEGYSDNIAAYNGWNHIIITFKPKSIDATKLNINDECLLTNPNSGTLFIYVNGKLEYKNENFIEPLFNPYPIDRTKQIGVPYNLSWGGGFVGLKNSLNFNIIDNNTPFDYNTENDNLIIQKYFDGYFKGGFQKLRIYERFFNLSDVRFNYSFEASYYNIQYNKGGRLIYVNDFIPNSTFMEEFELYWGILSTNVDYTNTDLTTLNKLNITTDGNISINDINLNNQYLLIVTSLSVTEKTKWYIDQFNFGDIGGISNLFANVVEANGKRYYITNYATTLDKIILRK